MRRKHNFKVIQGGKTDMPTLEQWVAASFTPMGVFTLWQRSIIAIMHPAPHCSQKGPSEK